MLCISRSFHAPINFIKQVLAEVQREVASDKALQNEVAKVSQAVKKVRESTASTKISETAQSVKDIADAQKKQIFEKLNEGAEASNDRIKHLRSLLKDSVPEVKSSPFFSVLSKVQSDAMESTRSVRENASKVVGILKSQTSSMLSSETQAQARRAQWIRDRDRLAAIEESREKAKSEALEKGEEYIEEAVPEENTRNELVVTKESLWSRIGLNSGNSAFIQSLNAGGWIGESDIAGAVRIMRKTKPEFNIIMLAEDLEHIILPGFFDSYLKGDIEYLSAHCGEAAYRAVAESILERKSRKVRLYESLLSAPSQIELRGTKVSDTDLPIFVYTFQTQQINCVWDSKGKVVEGAIDDIRDVYYAMALKYNEDILKEGIEHPWIITEMAVLGNQGTI